MNALIGYRNQYSDASGNDLRQNQLRGSRNSFLCTFISGAPQVEDWTGRVKSIDRVLFGLLSEYGFSVYIGKDITVETYGSALGERNQRDAGTPTNIRAGSRIADVIARLAPGDQITFNGAFILANNGCATERSITTSGSFSAPQLLFRFNTINGVSGNQPPPVSSSR